MEYQRQLYETMDPSLFQTSTHNLHKIINLKTSPVVCITHRGMIKLREQWVQTMLTQQAKTLSLPNLNIGIYHAFVNVFSPSELFVSQKRWTNVLISRTQCISNVPDDISEEERRTIQIEVEK